LVDGPVAGGFAAAVAHAKPSRAAVVRPFAVQGYIRRTL
jgi:hypothetical protein